MKSALQIINKSESLSAYLLSSIILHLCIFIYLISFMDIHPIKEIPSTEITFLRLSKTTTPQQSNEVVESPTKNTTPENKSTPAKVEPQKKEVKKETVADLLKENKKQVVLPYKNKKIEKKVVTPTEKTKAKPNTVTQQNTGKAKVDNSQVKNALAGIEKQLSDREKVSSGTGNPNGTAGGNITADDPSIAAYRSTVKAKVVRNLRWPGGTSENILITKISFRLSPSGGLISASFAKRSNNGAFDEACMRAVQAASPFPPPPVGAVSQGFLVEFRKRL